MIKIYIIKTEEELKFVLDKHKKYLKGRDFNHFLNRFQNYKDFCIRFGKIGGTSLDLSYGILSFYKTYPYYSNSEFIEVNDSIRFEKLKNLYNT